MEGIDKRDATSLSSSLAILLLLVAVSMYALVNQPIAAVWLNGPRTDFGWYRTIHTSTNAFLIWHDGVFSFLEPIEAKIVSMAVFSLLFFLGTVKLFSLLQTLPMIGRAVVGSCLYIALVIIIGFDVKTWAVLACIPLMATSTYYGLTKTDARLRDIGLAVFLAFLATIFSQSYSIPGIFFAVLIALCLKKTQFQFHPLLRDRSDVILLVILFAPWLLCTFIVPLPDFPAYSPLGHVVPDDGLPGNILPLFAPMPPIPVMDRTAIRSSFAEWGFILSSVSFLVFFSRRTPLNLVTLCCSLLLTLDTSVPEWISQIAPLATTQRLVPFLFFYPIQIPVLALTILLLTLSFFRHWPRLTTPFIASLILIPILAKQNFSEQHVGSLFPGSHGILQKELRNFSAAPEFTAYVERVVVSPSFATLNKTGLWPLHIRDIIQHWSFSSLLRERPIISTHAPGIEPIENMFDRNIGTRWSPGGGGQTGREWVYIYLPEPQTIHGLEITAGPFHTDFARGLRVSLSQSCVKRITSPSEIELKTFISIPEWEGSLTLTNDGYPYFGGQGGGRLYLQAPTTIQCILIEQTGRTNGFDWSIAELRTLKYPQ